MSSFTRPLHAVYIGKGYWRVDRSFRYYIGYEGSNDFVDVLLGYLTDLDSTPWGVRWLVRMNTDHNQADVGHDYLYTVGRLLKFISDRGGRIEPTDWVKFSLGGEKVYLKDLKYRSRKECDDIYLEMMETINNSPHFKIPAWRRRIMYRAVRIGGGWNMKPDKVFKRIHSYKIACLGESITHS